MKKKVIAALLACMMVSVTACSGTDTKDTKTSSEKELTDASEDSDTSEETESDTDTDTSEEIRLVSVDDISEYIKLGEYKGLTLERMSETVTDDDVDLEIEFMLEDSGTEVSDGTVEDGDTVTINFTGTIDGKEFDGGSAEDYELIIGNGEMIDGFEEGIIGMQKGDTKDVEVTFPEDYYEEDVAGKDAVFTITLQKFTRPAEFNDEWVAANTDYETAEEYYEVIRKELEETYAQSADYVLYSDAWNAVYETTEVIAYPEEDVAQAEAAYKAMYEQYAEESGIELEELLEAWGMTEEEYEEECRSYAEEKAVQNLIVQAIMDAEGISLNDEETQELKDELVAEYGFNDLDEMIATYGEQEVNESLALVRIERFIVENATISEMTEDGEVANEDADEDSFDTEIEEILTEDEDMDIAEESEDAVEEDTVIEE